MASSDVSDRRVEAWTRVNNSECAFVRDVTAPNERQRLTRGLYCSLRPNGKLVVRGSLPSRNQIVTRPGQQEGQQIKSDTHSSILQLGMSMWCRTLSNSGSANPYFSSGQNNWYCAFEIHDPSAPVSVYFIGDFLPFKSPRGSGIPALATLGRCQTFPSSTREYRHM